MQQNLLFDGACHLTINHPFPNHFPGWFLRVDFDSLTKHINEFSAEQMQHGKIHVHFSP